MERDSNSEFFMHNWCAWKDFSQFINSLNYFLYFFSLKTILLLLSGKIQISCKNYSLSLTSGKGTKEKSEAEENPKSPTLADFAPAEERVFCFRTRRDKTNKQKGKTVKSGSNSLPLPPPLACFFFLLFLSFSLCSVVLCCKRQKEDKSCPHCFSWQQDTPNTPLSPSFPCQSNLNLVRDKQKALTHTHTLSERKRRTILRTKWREKERKKKRKEKSELFRTVVVVVVR